MSAVRIIPGATALTRISGPYSSAALAVIAATPALAAEYAASPAAGRVPLIDDVLTIAPPPASPTVVRISGHAGAEAVEDPGEVDGDEAGPLVERGLVDVADGAGAGVVEEQREAPHRLGGVLERRLETFVVGDVDAVRVAVDLLGDTVDAASPSMSSTATCAPSAAIRRAVARPIPDPPPVIAARCPSSIPIGAPLLRDRIVEPGAATRGRPGDGGESPPMWKATVRGLFARKVRLTLTALAIVLGVAFVSGTYVLTDTLKQSFGQIFAQTAVNVDLVVRSQAAVRQQRRRRLDHPGPDARRRRRPGSAGARGRGGRRVAPGLRAVRREGRQDGDRHRRRTVARVLVVVARRCRRPAAHPRRRREPSARARRRGRDGPGNRRSATGSRSATR